MGCIRAVNIDRAEALQRYTQLAIAMFRHLVAITVCSGHLLLVYYFAFSFSMYITFLLGAQFLQG